MNEDEDDEDDDYSSDSCSNDSSEPKEPIKVTPIVVAKKTTPLPTYSRIHFSLFDCR